MKMMKKALLWLWLLTKRLYKKPTFLAILILIPLLVVGYSAVADRDAGMLTVALAGEDDPLTPQVLAQIQSTGQLLRYIECETPAQAEQLVSAGKADAAWIFPEKLQEAIDDFVDSPVEGAGFVRVVQREENVALALAREKLSGVIYTHMAKSYYKDFVRETYPELKDLTDEELMQYYNDTVMNGELFAFGTEEAVKTETVHYLMSPLRGLLAVVVVLGGMATAMYAIRDQENGTFGQLAAGKQWLPELGGQLAASLDLGAVAYLALLVTGLASNFFAELGTWLLYSVCVAAFCMLLRRLLGSIRGLGTAMPLLVVGMLLVCPVFFDLGAMRGYQLLLPPTYFINAAYDYRYLLYMPLFCLACGLLCYGIDRLQRMRVRS